jgi:hypothetical protein
MEKNIKRTKKPKKNNVKIDLSETSNNDINININNKNINTKNINNKNINTKNINNKNKLDEVNKTNEFINNVTLECLIPSNHYEKYIRNNNVTKNSNEINNANNDDEEIIFYKERIINLIDKMFNKEFPNDSLQYIFNKLIENSINYLQEIDTFDLYQENYEDNKNDNNNLKNDKNDNLMNTPIDLNNYIINKNENILDDFVTKKKINLNTNNNSFPKRKKINLKSQQLKNKGLK